MPQSKPRRAVAIGAVVVASAVALAGGGIAMVGAAIGGTEQPLEAPNGHHGQAPEDESADTGTTASVTPEQQAAAGELVATMKVAIAPYADVTAAEAAGYRWIGDGRAPGEYRHYVQPRFFADDVILDPAEVESLVYQTGADGTLTLVSGMFILPPGQRMDDVPDVAGDLTVWHEHTDLCFRGNGTIEAIADDGTCPDGSAAIPTPPMLHVWVVEHPDGPFAGIEGHGDH